MCALCDLPDSMPLKSKRCDEDVDEDGEEDKDCCHIVHPVQLCMFPHIVKIILHCRTRVTQQQNIISDMIS